MRKFIDIVEAAQHVPVVAFSRKLGESTTQYSDMSQQDFIDLVNIEDDNSDGTISAEDSHWVYDPSFPVSELFSAGGLNGEQEWKEWFFDEIDMDSGEHLGRNWSVLSSEEIKEPVILARTPTGEIQIWNGYHRVAGSIVRGSKTIPAIYGVPNMDVSMNIRDLINIVEAADYHEWTPDCGIDDFVKTEFTTGGCAALAVALAENTGWDVAADFLGGEIEHAWCLNGSGKAVDINGVHNGQIAVTKYGRENGVKAKRIKLDALRADIQDKGMLEWARQIVELFPEHFGIAV